MKKIIACAVVLAGCGGNAATVETTTTTTEPKPESITIVAVGDIACSTVQRNSLKYDCVDPWVADTARAQNPDMVFALGDIQYNSHQTENFEENFGVYWEDMIPIIRPIPGNHEYGMGGAKGYYKAWVNFPKPGYYSFDINDDWHVVALNTNDECKFVACDEGSDQYAWLQADLEANAGKCIIAMGHHPRYSSGRHGQTRAVGDMYELMAKHNVQVYLSGHDHNYERLSAPVTQFVVGTGGKDLREMGNAYSSDTVQQEFASSEHHGILVITITELTMETKFVSVEGKVIDEYSQPCIY